MFCGNQIIDGVLDLSVGVSYDFLIVVLIGFILMVDDVNVGQYIFGLGIFIEIIINDGCVVMVFDDEVVICYSDV